MSLHSFLIPVGYAYSLKKINTINCKNHGGLFKKIQSLSPRIRNWILILALTSIIILLSVGYSLTTVSANPSKTGYGISHPRILGAVKVGSTTTMQHNQNMLLSILAPAMPDSSDHRQMEITGTVEKALVSPIDAPWNHFSHDMN